MLETVIIHSAVHWSTLGRLRNSHRRDLILFMLVGTNTKKYLKQVNQVVSSFNCTEQEVKVCLFAAMASLYFESTSQTFCGKLSQPMVITIIDVQQAAHLMSQNLLTWNVYT